MFSEILGKAEKKVVEAMVRGPSKVFPKFSDALERFEKCGWLAKIVSNVSLGGSACFVIVQKKCRLDEMSSCGIKLQRKQRGKNKNKTVPCISYQALELQKN